MFFFFFLIIKHKMLMNGTGNLFYISSRRDFSTPFPLYSLFIPADGQGEDFLRQSRYLRSLPNYLKKKIN